MWESSGNCGRCAELHYGNNCVQVMIVDLCGSCKDGDLDLSNTAFAALTNNNMGLGRAHGMTWDFVTCSDFMLDGGPQPPSNTCQGGGNKLPKRRLSFKAGSSQWWMGLAMDNVPIGIEKMEIVDADGKRS